jgi:transketolase
MEGISHEVCSLAGTLGLGKLVAFYDDNGISIDGKVDPGWFTDDTPKRFAAYGWHVVRASTATTCEAVAAAIEGESGTDRPTLICCRTVIGKGSPNKAAPTRCTARRSARKEVAATREAIGWKHPPFEIPSIYAGWDARVRGAGLEKPTGTQPLRGLRAEHPELAASSPAHRRRAARRLAGCAPRVPRCGAAKGETIATRKASQNAIEALAPRCRNSSAARPTWLHRTSPCGRARSPVQRRPRRQLRLLRRARVRHGGDLQRLALHGGFIPTRGTFLTFSDYSRNALRMAALMRCATSSSSPTIPSAWERTGRRTSRSSTWRACASFQTWTCGALRHGGDGRGLGCGDRAHRRADLARAVAPEPAVRHAHAQQLQDVSRGGYVVSEANGAARAIIIATGSEVALALQAQKQLAAEGFEVRVVSMPSTTVFDRQAAAYRDAVLPKRIRRVAVEAGISDFWRKYVGLDGAVLGIDRFGESAPAGELFKYFGFTAENLAQLVKGIAHA